jgi:signal transduction histidine kinase
LQDINALQKESARQIIQAQEQEQRRIAQDVHDELGGVLAAIKMTVQSFRLEEERSKWLHMLIDRASANARAIAHNLMPPEFADTRLEDLLRDHFHRLNQEGNTAFYFLRSGNDHHFSKQDELMMYRIIMELVNNSIRHAVASEITLQLIYHAEQLSIMVEDNGKGFPEPVPAEGMGLRNIRSRVNYLGGVLSIDSGGQGTTIIIHIPYKDEK